MDREAARERAGQSVCLCSILLYQILRRPELSRRPKDHINIRILRFGAKAQYKGGMPDRLFCRILMFMWSFLGPTFNPKLCGGSPRSAAKGGALRRGASAS